MTKSLSAVVADLRRHHLERNNRRDETAMGEEGAVALLEHVQRFQPAQGRLTRVADLGSGFSSTVLRWLARTYPLDVWTVDHEWRWLGSTLDELERQELGTAHCHHLSIFAGLPLVGFFDLIFMDLGPTALRAELAESGKLTGWLQTKGILLLDDWHMPHYRERMQPALERHGYQIGTVENSLDKHGRYLAIATLQGD